MQNHTQTESHNEIDEHKILWSLKTEILIRKPHIAPNRQRVEKTQNFILSPNPPPIVNEPANVQYIYMYIHIILKLNYFRWLILMHWQHDNEWKLQYYGKKKRHINWYLKLGMTRAKIIKINCFNFIFKIIFWLKLKYLNVNWNVFIIFLTST